jgi:hypothetical protein
VIDFFRSRFDGLYIYRLAEADTEGISDPAMFEGGGKVSLACLSLIRT